MKVNTKIVKWGNGYGLHIQKDFLNILKAKEGDIFEMSVNEDQINLRPEKKNLSLAEMSKLINKNNIHKDYFCDMSPVGKEIW